MTKDVFITISGLQYEVADEGPLEVLSPGTYYNKNGKHYVRYDEALDPSESVNQTIPPDSLVTNTLKIEKEKVELIKHGAVDVQMIFEPGKKYDTVYHTPYGKLIIGLHTGDVQITEKPDEIKVHITYSLDMNYAHSSDCTIDIHIRSKLSGE